MRQSPPSICVPLPPKIRLPVSDSTKGLPHEEVRAYDGVVDPLQLRIGNVPTQPLVTGNPV